MKHFEYNGKIFSFYKAGLVFERANKASIEGARVEAEALKVREKLLDGAEQVQMIVSEINRLVIGLETGTGKKLNHVGIHQLFIKNYV